MVIYQNGKKFKEFNYNREEDLEADVRNNYKNFFGTSTIYIDIKRKIEGKSLGKTIPDGFLFDLADKENPEFYLVEVELSKHDFYDHIFPQITKFFAFYKNTKSQADLVEKIFSVINTNTDLRDEFKKYLRGKEIYKFIKDTIENSQNILLIIDETKNELPEVIETYTDTWGKMVKPMILKKFFCENEYIITLNPDFEEIEIAGVEPIEKEEIQEDVGITEEFHLEDVRSEIKKIYFKIKDQLLEINKNLVFNPQKYYISIIHKRNIAFFKLKKKKIRLVVMLPEEEVQKKISKHTIKHLSEGVQKFWNGPSCEIIIDSEENIEEIISLLRTLVA